MFTSSAILDLAIAAVIALCVFFGMRRGLVRSLADLAACIAALIAASLAAGHCAPLVVERLRPLLEGQVSEAITIYLQGLLTESGTDGLLDGLLDSASGAIDGVAGTAVEIIAGTILLNIAYVALYVAVFLMVALLLRFAVRLLDRAAKLPVLHQANTLGGLMFGFLKGFLIVALVLWLDGKLGMLIAPQALESSVLASFITKLLPA